MRHVRCARGASSVRVTIRVTILVFACCFVILVVQARRKVKRFGADVKQRAQLHLISAVLELHERDFGDHPSSEANDPAGAAYCGAMKLAEAAMGQDLLGIHCETVFRADGLSHDGSHRLYPAEPNEGDLDARKGPYLQRENANAYRLVDIYGEGNTGSFDGNAFVLCDVYGRRTACGLKTGMPILYYRADPNGTAHDVNDPDNSANIYDYRDNQMLLDLGVPGKPSDVHPLADAKRFYMNTQSDRYPTKRKPYHADRFILISAGRDGLYGTADDICNFQWKYRE